MRLFKKLISMLLAVSMCLSLISINNEVYAASSDDYVKQLISYYKNYQDDAATDIERVLGLLKETDQNLGEAWEKIMNYWMDINQPGYVNEVDIIDNSADLNDIPSIDTDASKVAIVVLGFALNSDGTMKEELVNRLRVGLALANKYPEAYIAVTGGGTAANNPNVTEGGLMGEWLLEQGIDEDRIIVENKASNTVGNALNTYNILNTQYPDVDSIIMVTSDYHVPRGSILFYSKFVLSALEQNGKEIKIINNAGNETGSNGYESLSLQVNGVCSVAGISSSSLPSVTLSRLNGIQVSLNTPYISGRPLDLKAEAYYNTDFTKDISEEVTISGFDPSLDENQTITITYEENGIEITCDYQLNQGEQYFTSYKSLLQLLIQDAEDMDLNTYTETSKDTLIYAIDNAKSVLADTKSDEDDLIEAYNALTLALNSLVTRVNVALNKTVIASHNNAEAYKIVDGSASTYWSSYEGGNIPIEDSHVIVDLEGIYSLDSINVTPYYATNNRYYNFGVYVSTDNINWTLAGEYRGTEYSTEDGYNFTLDTLSDVRYIKVVGYDVFVSERPDINNFHIVEIKAYGTLKEEVRVSENIALHGHVTTSGGSKEYVLTDGNKGNSYWSSNADIDEAYAIVELPALASIDSINVINYYNNMSKWYTYEVLISTDNINYESVGKYELESNSGIDGYLIQLDEPVSARYIKVQGLKTNNTKFHLVEIEVFGYLDNIALNKDVSVNYERNGYPGSRVTDGDFANHWDTGDVVSSVDGWNTLAEASKPYAIIDLESVYAIDTINITTYKNASRYYNYTVYISEDGETYSEFASKDDQIISSYSTSFDAELLTKARYIKVVGDLCSAAKGFHLCEVRAYGSLHAEENYALNGNVTINNGSNASHVTDGKKPQSSNYWASDNIASESYCIIELTEFAQLSKIVVIPYYKVANYYYNYEVLISTDNINYTSVASYTDKTGNYTSAGQSFILEIPSNARYVKIQGIESNNKNKIHIVEVEAYGVKVKEGSADYTKVYEAISQVPSNLSIYTAMSVVSLKSLISGIDYSLPASKQLEVDAYADSILDAIEKLIVKPADYSELNNVIKTIPADLSDYTDESVEQLNSVLESINNDLDITQQPIVDEYVLLLNTALSELKLKDADYTKVDEAISSVPGDLTIYVEETVQVLTTALSAVIRGLDITQQSLVDDFAKAIVDAISSLIIKPADYKQVNEAIARAESIDTTYIRDFSEVNEAVNAVVEGLDITHQDEVNAYAKAINDAIDALKIGKIIEIERMSASAGDAQSGEEADKAIDNNVNTMWHTDWYVSEPEKHYFIIILDKITNINGFKLLNRQNNQDNGSIAKYNFYTRTDEYSDWELLIENGTLDMTSKQWQTVDFDAIDVKEIKIQVLDAGSDQPGLSFASIAEFRLYETGVEAKQLADYSDVNKAIADAQALIKEHYADFSEVEKAIEDVVRGIREDEQSRVDAMAKVIKDAINNLVLLSADYSEVEDIINEAKSLDKNLYKDFSEVEESLASVIYGLDITKQNQVDNYASEIRQAINNLEYKDASITDSQQEIIDQAKSLDKDIYKDISQVESLLESLDKEFNITEQQALNDLINELEEALDLLEYKDADYTKVDEAIEQAELLNRDMYKDLADLDKAIESVIRGLPITKQDEADAMAETISNAILGLEYKDADYSELDEIIEVISKLNKEDYKDFSEIDSILLSLDRNLNISEQNQVDEYVQLLNKALSSLEVKDEDIEEDQPSINEDDKEDKDDIENKDDKEDEEEKVEDDTELEESVQPDNEVNTNDSTPVFAFVAVLFLAVITFLFTLKRKK